MQIVIFTRIEPGVLHPDRSGLLQEPLQREVIALRRKIPAMLYPIFAACSLLVIAPSAGAFIVYPHDGAGDCDEYESGDATVDIAVSYWDGYPYMADGGSEFESGSGLAYWWSDVSWYTDSDEVEGATNARMQWEVDYVEEPNKTGNYLYYSFRVYEKVGSSWSLVGQCTNEYDDDYYNMGAAYIVYHDFTDNEYKYRFIHKLYLSESAQPEATQTLTTEIWDYDEGEPGGQGTYLGVSDED